MAIAERYGGNKNTRNTGITQTLLWTNSDPTADFAAQTISIDLSGYYAVLVQCGASDGQVNDENIIPIGGSGRVQYAGYTSANARIYFRDITTAATGVTFGACNRFTQGTSGTTTVATALKCLRIYGIRGVT